MSYFTAVIARTGPSWRAVDVDLEDAESLDEVADKLRVASRGGPVLAVLEREDDWFALVRVDGDDDARTFVSDLAATERSHYAAVLAPVGDVELAEYSHLRAPSAPADEDAEFAAADDFAPEPEAAGAVPTSGNGVDGEPVPIAVTAPAAVTPPPPWAGDPGLLSDVGIDAEDLVELVHEGEGDPASVIAAVGERCGFDELLDALR